MRLDLEWRRRPSYDFHKLAAYIKDCKPDAVQQKPQRMWEAALKWITTVTQRRGSLPRLTTITIKRGTAQPLSPPEALLLATFWNGDLDTHCMLCHQPFDGLDPPIRTVSLETTSPLVIQVHNRHLSCIKKYDVPFIPMSHVWSESIADANLSMESNVEASKCLLTVLSGILPAITARFSRLYPRIELWHDYLSIPQWQRAMQQALLLTLPDIYKTAPLCLIYFDDVNYEEIVFAADNCTNRSIGRSPTAVRQSHYSALAAFFRARWFQRMWVTVEYAYCRQACVLTKDNVILWDGDERNLDSFSKVFDGFQQKMRKCVEEFGEREFREIFHELPVPLLGPLADMRKNVCAIGGGKLCFGEALTFIADRSCTCYRDRFLAMSGFLQIGGYASSLQTIPNDSSETCLWLARRCLQKGDYSPLLMLQKDEPIHPQAHWLVGHQRMTSFMWDLGPIKSTSHECISMKDNLVQLQLDHVGTVEQVWVLDFRSSNYESTFDHVIEVILSHYGNINLSGILNTLERVYAVPEFIRPPSMGSTFSQNVYNLKHLQELLAQHYQHQVGSDQRLKISARMSRMLSLHVRLKGTAAEFTRLSYASSPLHQADGYNDCLVSVRCPDCAKSFLYRVSILKDIDGPLRLYRIPGFECRSTLRDGVGLLISEKEIVGRMIFGTPSCGCKVMEKVEVC